MQTYPTQQVALLDWIVAQDHVFANCARPATLPAEAPPDSPDWLRQDRAYQRAAALLYAGRSAEAVEAFDTIAHDPQSSWRLLAPYLAARVLVRQAMTMHRWESLLHVSLLAEAEQRLQTIRADATLAAVHAAAHRLLNFVQIRLHPHEHLQAIDHLFSGKPLPDDLPQTLIDHSHFYARFGHEMTEPLQFSDWIRAMRGQGDALACGPDTRLVGGRARPGKRYESGIRSAPACRYGTTRAGARCPYGLVPSGLAAFSGWTPCRSAPDPEDAGAAWGRTVTAAGGQSFQGADVA